MVTKILIVDDEQGIVDLISAYLKPEGYQIHIANTGTQALEMAEKVKPDLIVLDVMLPEMDGIAVLAELRRTSDTYVIMLTAKTDEMDKVVGLTVGADDYVTKPFSPRELTARIKSALRRIQNITNNDKDELIYGDLRIDVQGYRVWEKDQLIELTTREFELLLNLAQNAGRVLSREQLLENIWGHDYYGEIRVVDVHLGHVRQKIGEKYIETVRGVGYRFSGDEQ